MDIINFLNDWKDAIISAYTINPFISALIIILEILLYFGIKNGLKLDFCKGSVIKKVGIFLLIFLVGSPVLGTLINLFISIFGTLQYLYGLLEGFYSIYSNSPKLTVGLFVIILILYLISLIPYVKKRIIGRYEKIYKFRIFILIFIYILLLLIINPFLK